MRKLTEHDLQAQIVAFLDMALPRDQRIAAVSNNPRSKATGGLEKVRGMKAGLPDLMLVGRICGMMEVKRPGQKLRPNQFEWQVFCFDSGMKHAVVHSVEDALDALQAWGVKLSERVHL